MALLPERELTKAGFTKPKPGTPVRHPPPNPLLYGGGFLFTLANPPPPAVDLRAKRIRCLFQEAIGEAELRFGMLDLLLHHEGTVTRIEPFHLHRFARRAQPLDVYFDGTGR